MIAQTIDVFAGLVGLLASSGAACFVGVPSAEDIVAMERKIVSSRKDMPTGRIVLLCRYAKFSKDPQYEKYTWRYTLQFKGEKARCDLNLGVSTDRGELSESTVWTNDTFIRVPGAATAAIQVFGPDSRPPRPLETPDARRFGLVPWNIATINQFGMEWVLLRPDRKNIHVEEGVYDGEPVYKVSSQVGEGAAEQVLECWLAPEKGGLPVHVAVGSGEGQPRSLAKISCRLKQYDRVGADKVWYPAEVTFQTYQGNELLLEEVETVVEAKFGGEIDDKTFTLAGLGIAPGRLVNIDSKLMWWTGDRLEPKGIDEESYAPTTEAPERRPYRWLLILNAVVFSILAVLILVRRWRRATR